ncbi:hypothetical protein [Alkalihalobacillus sp. 1P02AB]|uniref:hypothetical protein n=1 Tax=Alkalihalobacillus sp. 1P02AB TaxID=3132260 RepID=UPI0039A6C1C5
MRLRENVMDVYSALVKDKDLLKLLVYPAKNLNDNVLIDTLDRPDILSLPDNEKWGIINSRITPTVSEVELETDEVPRVLFYPHNRSATGNYKTASQDVIIDVLVPHSFQNDFRLEWICDKIADILFNKHVTGLGKMDFVGGSQIGAVSKHYVGFRLRFAFGSVK